MRARQRGERVPLRRPGPRRRPADLSAVPLSDLAWEIAERLDNLSEPVIERNSVSFSRIDPELEELTVYHGTGPLAGYGGTNSALGTPAVLILPASEARESDSA
jgi:hypothetical protein